MEKREKKKGTTAFIREKKPGVLVLKPRLTRESSTELSIKPYT
jgi:hypothetical protein